ncbi:MAG: sel1 repeat family protein [Sandaracinaceae bacterium]|nr:sel1 repeat family protein [Sandaracinaceae bacterium]
MTALPAAGAAQQTGTRSASSCMQCASESRDPRCCRTAPAAERRSTSRAGGNRLGRLRATCERQRDATDACAEYATALFEQRGNPSASSLAVVERACGTHHIGAVCTILGVNAIAGLAGAQPSWPESARYFGLACDEHDWEGCSALASLLEEGGPGLPRDTSRAVDLRARACAGGFGGACHDLALMYLNGIGVRTDNDRAREYFSHGCGRDYGDSCFAMAIFARSGGASLTSAEVGRFARQGCAHRSADACEMVLERGVQAEVRAALTQLRAGCNADQASACAVLAGHLATQPRERRAFANFAARGCALGAPDACLLHAGAMLRGEGRQRDPSGAVELLDTHCTAGLAGACLELGRALLGVAGVRADERRAQRAFRAACEGGLEDGCRASRALEPTTDLERREFPQACGQAAGQTDYGTLTAGQQVTLGRHRPYAGSDNWSPEMDAYVGRVARVVELPGRDLAGCPVVRVDVDGQRFAWRIRDLSSRAAAAVDPRASAADRFSLTASETRRGVGGGPVSVRYLGASCVGYVNTAPSHTMTLTAAGEVRLVAQSTGDTTIAVLTPDGRWLCNDDFDGLNAGVQEHLVAGRYQIWVGAYQRDANPAYSLVATRTQEAYARGPQECGQEEASANFGSVRRGARVVLRAHRAVDSDPNWAPSMDRFVGQSTTVTDVQGVDNQGCPVVRVAADAGEFNWRVRDLEVVSAAAAYGWQDCGQIESAMEFGPMSAGARVRLGRHRPVGGDDNWAPDMDAFVGRPAQVVRQGTIDNAGCPVVRVDVDGQRFAWRIRDVALTQGAPTVSPTAASWRMCGQSRDSIDHGPLRVGSVVTLRRHTPIDGDANWAEDMDAFVGRRTRVTAIRTLDDAGCAMVEVEADAGQFVWRIRDLDVDGADSAPTPPPAPTTAPSPVPSWRMCGQSRGSVDHGPLRVGSTVTLRRHTPVNGDVNWVAAMDAFVGRQTRVSELRTVDDAGCAMVKVEADGGQFVWRIRDMDVEGAAGVPTATTDTRVMRYVSGQTETLVVQARGEVSLAGIGPSCVGFSPDLAHIEMEVAGDAGTVRFAATSGTNLVMVVRLPDGSFRCNDDFAGTNPAVDVRATSGVYRVWVGTFSQGASAQANVTISPVAGSI